MYRFILATSAIALVGLTGMQISVKAQEQPEATQSAASVSEQELEKFASAIVEIQTIQAESRQEAEAAIASTGLSPQRYSEILLEAEEQGQASETSDAELEQFDRAREQVEAISEQARADMEQAVQAQGLEVDRFNQIFAAVRENPELQTQVQQLIQERS